MKGWNKAVAAYAEELRAEGLSLDVRGSVADGFSVALHRVGRGRRPGKDLGSRSVASHSLANVRAAVKALLAEETSGATLGPTIR